MSGFRIRKNGLIELRFRYENQTLSVYGKTEMECLEKKEMKVQEMKDEEMRVFECCLIYCERMLQAGNVHENGYITLKKTARFIGRYPIGSAPISELSEKLIQKFKADVSSYSEYTVRRAIFMLNNVLKGADSYGREKTQGRIRGRNLPSDTKRQL